MSTTSSPPTNMPPLLGLATLMRMAFEGTNLAPMASTLLDRASRNPNDANALHDLATVLELSFKPDIARQVLGQALQIQTLFHLPPKHPPALRLLVLMVPGDIASNAPLPFLLEDSDVALDLLYVGPGVPSLENVPEHDVLFTGISESDENRPVLERLVPILADWPRPQLNRPERILETSREGAHHLLRDAPGVVMPMAERVERGSLERLARGDLAIHELVDALQFPIIVRPLESHAGRGLARIAAAGELAGYLAQNPEPAFYVSPFVDYRDDDGLFRKYRVALVDGRPYAGHMGVSEHWMIHYLNAGMAESADKRAEEARFMGEFDEQFARRHAQALAAIGQRFALEYLVLDCAETRQGELLIFEVDTGAVIHAMDPVDLFPYKVPAMAKVFAGFRDLLGAAAARGSGQSLAGYRIGPLD